MQQIINEQVSYAAETNELLIIPNGLTGMIYRYPLSTQESAELKVVLENPDNQSAYLFDEHQTGNQYTPLHHGGGQDHLNEMMWITAGWSTITTGRFSHMEKSSPVFIFNCTIQNQTRSSLKFSLTQEKAQQLAEAM
jgi:hypothetical protein